MSKKIIISESQYRRVFLNEQSSIDDIILYFNEDKGNVIEQTARLYRLWANSTPELSKKYGKDSEFDLDASRKPANSGTFEKSFSKGKSQFDKDYLIVPKNNKFLLFTKGGRTKYSVMTKKVLPEKLTDQDYFYIGDRDSFISDGETYPSGKGSKIKEELKNIYSSTNTNKATNVTQKEKESDEEELKEQKEELKRNLMDSGWPSSIISMEGKSSEEALARTLLEGMRELNRLISEKVISGVKGKYSVCVKGFGGCRNHNDGSYYMATNFDDLVNNTKGKKIGEHRVSDVVYNTDLSFNFGKVFNHVINRFEYNKNEGKSDLFPSGWWSFFKDYYGSDNYTEIKNRILSISPNKIKVNKETLNQYEKGTSIWEYIGECFSDYHCVLDVASIATLAIPGVGLAVSAGLDLINAASYGVEAASAKSSDERNELIIAGGLTMFGGIFGGGIKQTKYIITKGSANPKVYNYANDVMIRVEKELPQMKNLKEGAKNAQLKKIYKETAEKYGLKEGEEKLGKLILKDFSKIDPKVAKVYTEALTKIESKVGRANLLKVGKESGFQKVLLQNNGDVVVSLSKYMKTKAGKEALVELGLFIVLSEVMEIPEVQKWIGEKYNYLKYINRTDIQGLVEKEGYEWKSTKELFGSTGSVEDNTLLNKAWINGWRPSEDFSKSIEWLIKKPEYQTEKFKESILDFQKGLGSGDDIKITPSNEEEKIEGVKYYEEEEYKTYSQPYVVYNEDKKEEIRNKLKKYLE